SIIFEVDVEGQFKVIYTDAMYEELNEEIKRVFGMFPRITPSTYNGKPTFKQYSLIIKIPLVSHDVLVNSTSQLNKIDELQEKAQREFDSINSNLTLYSNKAYSSQLNIPFTHSDNARFDSNMNR